MLCWHSDAPMKHDLWKGPAYAHTDTHTSLQDRSALPSRAAWHLRHSLRSDCKSLWTLWMSATMT